VQLDQSLAKAFDIGLYLFPWIKPREILHYPRNEIIGHRLHLNDASDQAGVDPPEYVSIAHV